MVKKEGYGEQTAMGPLVSESINARKKSKPAVGPHGPIIRPGRPGEWGYGAVVHLDWQEKEQSGL